MASTYRYFTDDSLLSYTQAVATQMKSYVADNGGKIDVIKVNGTAQTISATDKSVNIAVPTKTSDLNNDSKYITSADVPDGATASTVTPLMDGTATRGTDTGFARGDHVHPTDTTRASATDLSNLATRVSTAETKLGGIDEKAEVNVIETVKVNGSALTADSKKAVNVTVPTDNASLANGAGYAKTSEVTSAVSTHNTSTTAHSDIRTLITNLTNRLNTLADSDDTTLDQLSEI